MEDGVSSPGPRDLGARLVGLMPATQKAKLRFHVRSPGDLDHEVRSWLREAYRVGIQEHLGSKAVAAR